jgi:hypothetical protein
MRFRLLAIAALSLVVLALGANGVRALERNTGDGQHLTGDYFIDFRARRGALLGHNFIVYGRLGAQGQLLDVEYAGNHPADGQLGLILGSVLPVRTKIGAVKEDFTDRATIIYRRRLTASQFAQLKATVRNIRAREHYWQLVLFNCNDFVVEVTRSLGLRTPSPWLPPHAFIAELRELNSR